MGDESNLRHRLRRCVYRSGGGTLPYRLFRPPGWDAGAKYPLIVFLHGAGERGSDNEAQLTHPEVLRLVADEARPCFLVAPQCPADCRWVEVSWSDATPHRTPSRPSRPMGLTLELLDFLDERYPIDARCRYVTGMSMGGFGTFDLLLRRPRDFAAAVVICGGADHGRIADIAHLPLWLFHGRDDPTVPVERSRGAVKALEAAGGRPRYTEYKGMAHNVWSRAYGEPELADWLFGQGRSACDLPESSGAHETRGVDRRS